MNQKPTLSLENKIQSEYGNIAGIIIRKNDRTVYEKYFNKCSENDPIHVFSVTKSIVSMLFGIALAKGRLKSLEENVIHFFPDYPLKKRQQTIRQITIRHLLTMTAPYQYKWNPYPKYFASEDWVRSSLGLLGGHGKIGNFRYAPVIGIDLLSGILIRATGQPVLEFAQDNLFAPLEIPVAKSICFRSKEDQLAFYKSKGANGWVADPKGTNTAGWGLSLATPDMAKLGQLYLNGGVWNGRQIIPEKWIAESTQVQSVWKARRLKYGYLWWVIEEAEHSFAALGDGGNAIYVNPKDRLVVAISSLFAPRTKDRVDFIKNEIEPLFR